MSNLDSEQPRKRKPKASMAKSRATVRENAKSITVRLLNGPECPGPLLASTYCTDVLEDSDFLLYAQEAVLQKGWPVTKMPHFLRGSNNAVEYVSRENDVETDSGHASQFVVGVYDRNINAVTLYQTAAHTIDRSAVGPNGLNVATSTNSVGLGYHANRAALGQAFGNARAKRGMEDVAKRTIDPRAVSLTITAVQESIDTTTGILPDDELALYARSPPLIPPVNHSAATVDEVYPLQNIVSTAELSSLDVDDLLSAPPESPTAGLPVRSRWVTYMISRIGSNPPIQDLQILVYIACLIGLFRQTSRDTERRWIEKQNPTIPSIVLDVFYDRFTESTRSSQEAIMTSSHQVKLISYILVLCLRMEHWTMEMHRIREDLGLDEAKIKTHFEAIGCRIIRKPSALNDPIENHHGVEHAENPKVATLDCPPTFPTPKMRKRRK